MKRNSLSWGSAVLAVASLFLSSFSGRAGGTVTGWGGNYAGQISPCASNIVAIAAGYEHSLYLLEDGTVADCGMFYGNGLPDSAISVPPGLSNVVAVSAGDSHSLALKADGTVVTWGLNYNGQTDVPAGLSNVAAIAAGGRYSLALKKDGLVVGWGGGGTNIPAGLSNVIAISAGAIGNNLALKADGTVIGWDFQTETASLNALTNIVAISSGPAGNTFGYESWLALKSNGDVISRSSSGVVSIVQSNAVAIACSRGTDHHISLALNANGTVAGWGYNFYGGPNVPAGLNNVVAVAAGYGHQLALVGAGKPFITEQPLGRTVGAGGTTRFRLAATGLRPLSYQWTLYGTNLPGATQSVLTLTDIQPAQAGNYAVRVSNSAGTTTSSDAQLTVIPILITAHPQNQQTFRYGTASIQISVQGQPPLQYQWLKNGIVLAGATNNPLLFPNAQPGDIADYSVVVSNTFGVATSGVASLTVLPFAVWGISSYLNPLPDLTNAIAVAAGDAAALGLKADGTVRAWGGPGSDTLVPAGLSNVVAIAAGGGHKLALRENGTLVLWGDDRYGLSAVTPAMTNIVAIDAGKVHSIALKADGTVLAWGYNNDGETNVPPGLNNVVRVAAGYYSCLALRDDGSVVGWGTVTPPAGLSALESADLGGGHGLGIKPDRTIVSWGNNFSGQTSIPAGLSNVVAVAGGGNHSLILTTAGKVLAWGENYSGQTNVPAQLTNVIAICGADSASFAMIGDGPPQLQVSATNATWQAGNFSVMVPSQSGRVYRLEYKSSLEETNWQKLPLVAGNGRLLTLIDLTANGSMRFYRVRQW